MFLLFRLVAVAENITCKYEPFDIAFPEESVRLADKAVIVGLLYARTVIDWEAAVVDFPLLSVAETDIFQVPDVGRDILTLLP